MPCKAYAGAPILAPKYPAGIERWLNAPFIWRSELAGRSKSYVQGGASCTAALQRRPGAGARPENGHDRRGRPRLDWRRLPEKRSWPARKPSTASAPASEAPRSRSTMSRRRAAGWPARWSIPTATGAARSPSILGCKLWLKFENQQFTASFKERGALNRLLACCRQRRRSGASSPCRPAITRRASPITPTGLSIPTTIVMPVNTPTVKVVNTRRHGAEVILTGETVEEAAAFAHAARPREGSHLHPPLRRSAGDRRAGHDGAGDAGRGARDRHAGRADRRRRPDLGHGRCRQGAEARHPPGRRAGPALSLHVQRHQGRAACRCAATRWPRASP